MEGLTVGRMVHYWWDKQCRAAVVTHVWDEVSGLVNLHVFEDGSYNAPKTPTSVEYSEKFQEGTWHWMEKV